MFEDDVDDPHQISTIQIESKRLGALPTPRKARVGGRSDGLDPVYSSRLWWIPSTGGSYNKRFLGGLRRENTQNPK